MARSREIRDAAARAWMRAQDNNAVRRADKANTRMTDLKDFKPNETVYVWRENNNFRGWSGPGVVVAISENNRSLWVSLRGYLLTVSKEHLRHRRGAGQGSQCRDAGRFGVWQHQTLPRSGGGSHSICQGTRTARISSNSVAPARTTFAPGSRRS